MRTKTKQSIYDASDQPRTMRWRNLLLFAFSLFVLVHRSYADFPLFVFNEHNLQAVQPELGFSLDFVKELYSWGIYGRFGETYQVIDETRGVNATQKHHAALYSQGVAALQLHQPVVPETSVCDAIFTKANAWMVFYTAMTVVQFVPGVEPLAKVAELVPRLAPHVNTLFFAGKAIDSAHTQYSDIQWLVAMKEHEKTRDGNVLDAFLVNNKQCAKLLSALWQQLFVVNQELQVSKQYSNHEKCESCFKQAQQCERPQSVEANNNKAVFVQAEYIEGKTAGTKEHCYCPGTNWVDRGCIDFHQREKDAVKTECTENMAAREATLNRTHKENCTRATGKLEREHSEQLANCTRASETAATHFWGPCLFLCLLVCICILVCVCLALRCKTLNRELQDCKKRKKGKAGARAQQPGQQPVDAVPEEQSDPHQTAVMIMAAVLVTQTQPVTLDSMANAVACLHKFDRAQADRFRKLQGFMQQVDPTTASIWEDIAEAFKQKA